MLNSIFITSLHPRQFMKIVPDAPGAFLKRSFSRFARALHTGQYTFSVSNIAAPFCIWIVARMGFEPTTIRLKVRCATGLRHRTLLGGSSPPCQTMKSNKHRRTCGLSKEARAESGNRTHNLLITNQMLCQLSYPGLPIWSSVHYSISRKG